MKKKFLSALCAFLLIGSTSCSNTGQEVSTPSAENNSSVTSDGSPGSLTIGLAMHNQTADWAVQFKDTFLKLAEENNVEVAWADANESAATQVNNIDDLVAQNVDSLVVIPADYSALGQALKTANDAGIPIVNPDSKVEEADQALVSTFITADSYAGGFTAGEYFAKILPENATIGTLNYPQISVIADRFVGMQDAFDKAGRTDIVVIEKIVTDLNAIATYTEDMLMTNPEITAFLCLNDNSALSCYGASKQMQREDVMVIGFDGSPAAKQSIANNEMYGTMVYSPVELATSSFEAAYALAKGETYTKEITVPMWLINRDNIGEYDVDHWE